MVEDVKLKASKSKRYSYCDLRRAKYEPLVGFASLICIVSSFVHFAFPRTDHLGYAKTFTRLRFRSREIYVIFGGDGNGRGMGNVKKKPRDRRFSYSSNVSYDVAVKEHYGSAFALRIYACEFYSFLKICAREKFEIAKYM